MIVMRSARSPLLKEAGDLSSALTDADGPADRAGSRHPDPPGRDGLHRQGVSQARARRDRLRDGDVWFLNLPEVGGNHLPDVKAMQAGLRRRPAGRLRDQPGPLGRTSAAPCPAATCRGPPSPIRRACASRRSGCSTADGPGSRETIDFVLANLRGREEREGDIFAQFARQRRRGPPAARALRALRRRDHRLACFERLHDESEAADAGGAPRAAGRGLRRRGLAGRRRRRRPADPRSACASRSRATRRAFDFTGTDPAGARPGQHDVLHRLLGRLLRHEALARAGRAAERRLLPAARRHRAATGRVLNADPDRAGRGRQPRDALSAWSTPSSRRSRRCCPTASRPADHHLRAADLPARGPDGRWSSSTRSHGGGEGAARDRDGASAMRVHMSNVMNTPDRGDRGRVPAVGGAHELRDGSRRAPPRRRSACGGSIGLWPAGPPDDDDGAVRRPALGALRGERGTEAGDAQRAGDDRTSRARRRSKAPAGRPGRWRTRGRRRVRPPDPAFARVDRLSYNAPGRVSAAKASLAIKYRVRPCPTSARPRIGGPDRDRRA